jgi:MerR family transcriptional regulator/heat shock protein HspR
MAVDERGPRTGPDDVDSVSYVISVAAKLTGLHSQTLRQYDRLGLVTPSRTAGGGRRYSPADIERINAIQEMSASGIGLAGVRRILELDNQVAALQQRLVELEFDLERTASALRYLENRHRAGGTVLAIRDSTTAVAVRRPGRTRPSA